MFFVYNVLPYTISLWASMRLEGKTPARITATVILLVDAYIHYGAIVGEVDTYKLLFWPPLLIVVGLVSLGVVLTVRSVYRKIKVR